MSNVNPRTSYYCVSAWDALEVSGQDSQDLLNRILTLDVKQLESGEGSWAFLLDHRGRVLESMWLLKRTPELWIAVSETGAESLGVSLDHFVFGERVNFRPLSDHSCVYLSWSGQAQPQLSSLEKNEWTVVPLILFKDSDDDEGLCVLPKTELEPLQSSLQSLALAPLSVEEFEDLRVSWGGPLPSREYDGGTPLDVGRRGVTEGKGCYPGQEVIERTLAIGKPSRRTERVNLTLRADELPSLRDAYHRGAPLSLFSSADSASAIVGELTSLSLSPSLSPSVSPSVSPIEKDTEKEMITLFGIARLKSKVLLDGASHDYMVKSEGEKSDPKDTLSISISLSSR